MKKFLLLSLLGLGMLLPTNTITAKESLAKRILTVVFEAWTIHVTSEPVDGPILSMTVRTVPGGVVMAQQDCGGHTCDMDISQLPAGSYVLRTVCAYRTYEKQFKKY